MDRIPEPELMTEEAQAIAYAQADFEEPHSMFIELFQQKFPKIKPNAKVIDLGCGAADISIRFAKAYPDCMIDAVDGSAAMLEQGRVALAKEGLQDRVTLMETLLQDFNKEGEKYDVVICNAMLHHLHDPLVLWDCIRRISEDSIVFIMDLMRPASTQEAAGMIDEYAAGEPEILRRDFYNSLCAAFSPAEVLEQLEQALLGQCQLEIVSDRHLIVHAELYNARK